MASSRARFDRLRRRSLAVKDAEPEAVLSVSPGHGDGPSALTYSAALSQKDSIIKPSNTLAPVPVSHSEVPVANMYPVSQANGALSRKRKGHPVDHDRNGCEPGGVWSEPHNPDDEPLPNLPALHPFAERAEKRATDSLKEILALLIGNTLQSPQASGLVKSIQGRPSPRYETAHQRVMMNET